MDIADQTAARTRIITWDDPAPRIAAAPTMSGLEFISAIAQGKLPAPPIERLIDMGMGEVTEGHVVFTLQPGEQHYNPLGTVHGGIIATVLDSAMGCAIQTTLPMGKFFTTLEIKVNYIAAVLVSTGQLRCAAKVIHRGSRTATADGTIVDAKGRLIAHGSTTCMILDVPAKANPGANPGAKPSVKPGA